MTERHRLTFDVSERIRRALYIEAARVGDSIGELIERLVTDHLSKAVALADEAIAEGKELPKQRRGRKPRGD